MFGKTIFENSDRKDTLFYVWHLGIMLHSGGATERNPSPVCRLVLDFLLLPNNWAYVFVFFTSRSLFFLSISMSDSGFELFLRHIKSVALLNYLDKKVSNIYKS